MLNPLRKMWTNINLIKFTNTYVPGCKAALHLKPSFCFPIHDQRADVIYSVRFLVNETIIYVVND